MKALGITDGSVGMVAQVRALAAALGVELEQKTVRVSFPWRFLPNAVFDWGGAKFFPVMREQWGTPELVISCGRKGALVAASLRSTQHQALSTKFIHIQDPQMSPAHFNVVVAMEHDKVRGENVITVPMALHDMTPEKLAAAKVRWEPKFAHLPKPWNAVLIGGSTNKYRFTREAMCELLATIDDIEGGLLITTSRRTGEKNIALLENYFLHSKRVFLYTGGVENPYPGMLACADEIYVTNDSVNMMSEALATGKKVHILPLRGHRNTKPARFSERHFSSPLEGGSQGGDPRRMMQDIAEKIFSLLNS